MGEMRVGEIIQLTAADGFTFDCYKADPAGTPKGGLLVIQEIFGVNSHMRGVADGYAADGYAVLCPALFDRAEKNFEVGYTPEDIARGRDTRMKVEWEMAVQDMTATVAALRGHGKVGAVGYCWGGSCAWLTATRVGVDASVCYYGGQIALFKDEVANNPVLMHFGEQDHGIPMEDIATVKQAQPNATVHIYPAGHGFNCEQRADFHPESAKLARERSMEFFAQHVG
jgi:carboxymethylenebutenolidase